MKSFEGFERRPVEDLDSVPGIVTPEVLKSRESADEILSALDSVDGLVRASNQRSVITELSADTLVVRREDPDQILNLLHNGEPVSLSFVGGTPYANSVEWKPKIDGSRGLDNAYLEGFSHKNNIVTVYGFDKPEDFYLEQLDDSQRVFNGVDRTRVRAAAGFVPLDAVQFVTVRIPINVMREEDLTPEEQDSLFDYNTSEPVRRKPVFVYRTYIRDQK